MRQGNTHTGAPGRNGEEYRRAAALLKATTELFVLDVVHDADELRRYEEIASYFLPRAAPDDRSFVAERLAICADAPSAVIGLLARDVLAVATPILKHSPVLSPADLLRVIAATGAEHHRLIASRRDLAPEVRRALWLTGDPIVIALIGDGAARPAADESQPVRIPNPASPQRDRGIDPWHFLGLDRAARLKHIASLAARSDALEHINGQDRIDQAFRSILGAARIVGFARSGQLSAIIASISEGLDLPTDLVAAATNDRSGELLAVMLKAMRLDDVQAQQVFLLASPSGRDIEAFFAIAGLYSCMVPDVAEAMVAEWREALRPNSAQGPNVEERRTLPPDHTRAAEGGDGRQARRA